MKKAIILLVLIINQSVWALKCQKIKTISNSNGARWASKVALNVDGTMAIVTWLTANNSDSQILEAAVRPHDNVDWESPISISDPMQLKNGTVIPYAIGDGVASIIWTDKNGRYYFSKKDKSGPWCPMKPIISENYPKIWDATFRSNGYPLVLASKEDENPYLFHVELFGEKDFQVNTIKNSGTSIPFEFAKLIKNKQDDVDVGYILKSAEQCRQFNYRFYNQTSKQLEAPQSKSPDMNIDVNKALEIQDISLSMNKGKKIAIIWNYKEIGSSYRLKCIVNDKAEDIAFSKDGFKNVAISIDDKGNAVAVWSQTFEGNYVVFASFNKNGKWTEVCQRLSNLSNKADNVEVSHHNGTFVVVWEEQTNETSFKSTIHGATLPVATFEWTPSVQLSPENQHCWFPSMAFCEKGGLITWTTHVRRSTHFQIQVADLVLN